MYGNYGCLVCVRDWLLWFGMGEGKIWRGIHHFHFIRFVFIIAIFFYLKAGLKGYQSLCEIVGLRVLLYKIVHVHRKFVETGEKLYQCLLSRVLKSDFQYCKCNVSYWWFQPEFSHVLHKTYENTYERKTIPVHWI